MDLTNVLQAAAAVRRARDGAHLVVLDSGVIHGMLRMLAADMVSLSDVDATARRTVTPLWPPAGRARVVPGHELAMPLPAPPGSARTLVFGREAGRPFSGEDHAVAALLQPHIADAVRSQSRRTAARLLTQRQRELLRLVAAGHDNVAIARRLGLSPFTVRKHLENAFARLDVSSRTEAVARVWPDVAWPELPRCTVNPSPSIVP